ncbi:MAG: hypothetical protein A2294_00045 [Candidatus Magasanikbacteria bacterium RIFOXYB2_FULL_38_10]|nr:MAG: hypothetical protein A2294_00045 [Candidatus Magasanikbacteria bacterium RIFOXYB2_FULL_38_10]
MLILLLVLGLWTTQVQAQQLPFSATDVVGDTSAAVGMSRHAFDMSDGANKKVEDLKGRISDLEKVKAELQKAKEALETANSGNQTLIQRMATVARLEKELPELKEDLKRALLVSEDRFGTQLGQIADTLGRSIDTTNQEIKALKLRVEGLVTRLKTVENEVDTLKSANTILDKRLGTVEDKAGVNLIPQFYFSWVPAGLAWLVGTELFLPTKTDWMIALHGNVGGVMTGSQPLLGSVGVGALKHRGERWQWGFGMDTTFTDTSLPGVISLMPTVGGLAKYKVWRVELIGSLGLGVNFGQDKTGFGWNLALGVGLPLF